jgi:DNA-directed RNA polymerase subunit RPC12/RpoP
MADFITCKTCRDEYLDLGGSGYSTCPRCGTRQVADRLKPKTQLTETAQWTCSKCKVAYSTREASSHSRCPKCGHLNKSKEVVDARRTLTDMELRDPRLREFNEWKAADDLERGAETARDNQKAKSGALAGLGSVLAVALLCQMFELGWIATLLIAATAGMIVRTVKRA